MKKLVFVTGGVCSSLGKGIAASSITRCCQSAMCYLPRAALRARRPRAMAIAGHRTRRSSYLLISPTRLLSPSVSLYAFGFIGDRVTSTLRPMTLLSMRWSTSVIDHVKGLLRGSSHPRFLSPAALRFLPGRTLIPRVLGEAPFGLEDLKTALNALGGSGLQEGERPWEEAPGISDDVARPIRGRSQELTYLKSLVFGLGAPGPRERILVLQGEEGLGQDSLAHWAAAAVETEGLWVAAFEVQHQEKAGCFLARMLLDRSKTPVVYPTLYFFFAIYFCTSFNILCLN